MGLFFCQVSILIRADKNQCLFVSTQRNLEPESAGTITQRSISGPDPFLSARSRACLSLCETNTPQKNMLWNHICMMLRVVQSLACQTFRQKKKRKGCTSINKHGSIVQYNFRVRSNDWLRQAGCETRAAKAWAWAACREQSCNGGSRRAWRKTGGF
jgi:hypothetical protein